jgi:hypothetical protein
MKIVAFLTQPATIDRILRPVGVQEPLLPPALPSPVLRQLIEEGVGLSSPFDGPPAHLFSPYAHGAMTLIDPHDGDPLLAHEDFVDQPGPDLECPDLAPPDFDDSS